MSSQDKIVQIWKNVTLLAVNELIAQTNRKHNIGYSISYTVFEVYACVDYKKFLPFNIILNRK